MIKQFHRNQPAAIGDVLSYKACTALQSRGVKEDENRTNYDLLNSILLDFLMCGLAIST